MDHSYLLNSLTTGELQETNQPTPKPGTLLIHHTCLLDCLTAEELQETNNLTLDSGNTSHVGPNLASMQIQTYFFFSRYLSMPSGPANTVAVYCPYKEREIFF
jgi:hypothetical protein